MASFYRQRLPGLAFTGAFAATNFTLNQSTDQAEWLFKAADVATLTRGGIRVGAISGTATTWNLSLQGVDGASGIPDGTIKGGGSPASVTFTNASVAANGWYWFNFANSYACTRGEDLALVLAYDSGTAPSAGVNDISPTMTGGWGPSTQNAFSIQNDNGSRTKGSAVPVFGYGSASIAYGWPMETAVSTVFNSSGTNEYGIKFNIPTTHGSSYKIAGARLLEVSAASGSYELRLYSGTTVIQTATVDADNSVSTSAMRIREVYFADTTLATLSNGSDYRIAVAPLSANNTNLTGYSLDAAGDWDAYPGQQQWPSTSRAGGAWTDLATTRYAIEPIFDDWTVASGGSGTGMLINGGLIR